MQIYNNRKDNKMLCLKNKTKQKKCSWSQCKAMCVNKLFFSGATNKAIKMIIAICWLLARRYVVNVWFSNFFFSQFLLLFIFVNQMHLKSILRTGTKKPLKYRRIERIKSSLIIYVRIIATKKNVDSHRS